MSEEFSVEDAFRRLSIATNEAAQAVTSLTVEMLIGTRLLPSGEREWVGEGGMTRSEAWAYIFEIASTPTSQDQEPQEEA